MKKIKLDAGKLQLKREKIASLSNEHMSKIFGGLNPTDPKVCSLSTCTPPPSVEVCPPPASDNCSYLCNTQPAVCGQTDSFLC